MRWRLSAKTKIAGRLHQPATEVMVPDAIDHYPGGERIFGIDNPIGQFATAALREPLGQFLTTEHLQKTAAHLFSLDSRVALPLHLGIVRIAFGDGIGNIDLRKTSGNFCVLTPQRVNLVIEAVELLFLIGTLPDVFPLITQLVNFCKDGRQLSAVRTENLIELFSFEPINKIGATLFMLGTRVRKNGTVENSVERIVVAGRDGIEFMIVALAAVGRQAEIDPAERLYTVRRVYCQVLFVNRSAFIGRDIATLQSGRNELILCWIGQHVTGNLLDGELVKWLI